MDNIEIEIYLQDPKVQNKRLKLQHILAAAVMLLMGLAFVLYPYPFLRLAGAVSLLSALLIMYFLFPSNADKLVRSNVSLRYIEIGSFVLLMIGFILMKRYMNAGFMALLSLAFTALVFYERRTSSVRQVVFSPSGISFQGLHKKFAFAKNEIEQIVFSPQKLTLKFKDSEFLQFLLVSKVNESDKEYLQNLYLNEQ